MYKTYFETKHENRDRLGPSEMGQAGYLLTRPSRIIFDATLRGMCDCNTQPARYKTI